MVDNKNILINIVNPFCGLWLSVAKALSSDYNVVVLCEGHTRKRHVEETIPDVNVVVELKDEYYMKNEIHQVDIMDEVVSRERKYGETFSLLCSMDRGLGKGYLFNADKYPSQGMTWWPHKKKLKKILDDFVYWEYIIDKYSPALILGHAHIKILSILSRHNKIKYLCVLKARFGQKWMWSENEYTQNVEFAEKVKDNVSKFSNVEKGSHLEYIRDNASLRDLSQVSFDFKTLLKKAVRIFVYDSYRKLRQTYNEDKYKPWAWLPIIFRSYFRYKYFLEYGKKPDDLKGYKIVFFTLCKEPEQSLLEYAPEFNNSMEIISWVSKSLHADTLLVIRENLHSYGIRSKQFHDNLRSMGNVVLAHPEISSWEWIKRSKLVVTIVGTVGVEAVYFDKPVITYSRYYEIGYLPTVRYADSYYTTKEATNELLSLSENSRLFEISKRSLYHAQMDVAFELKDFMKINRSKSLHMDYAKIIVENLKKKYNF